MDCKWTGIRKPTAVLWVRPAALWAPRSAGHGAAEPPYPSCPCPAHLLPFRAQATGLKCIASVPASCPGAGPGGASPTGQLVLDAATRAGLNIPGATQVSGETTGKIMVDLEQKRKAPLWTAIVFNLKRLAHPQA